MSTVFISYRRGDSSGHTGRLFDGLEYRFGRDAFFRDIESLEYGIDFPAELDKALAKCRVMLVMIGPGWLGAETNGTRRLELPDDFVRIEVAAALARDDVRTIPVLVGGAKMPSADELPAPLKALAARNCIEISDTRWDYDLGRLAQALARHTGLPDLHPTGGASLKPVSNVSPVETRGGGLGKGSYIAIGAVLAGIAIIAIGAADGDDTLAADAVDADGVDLAERAGDDDGVHDGEPAVEAAPHDLVQGHEPGDEPAERPQAIGGGDEEELPTFEHGGLVWTTDTEGEDVDWNEALAHCHSLGDGWRLPRIPELRTIADPRHPTASGLKLLLPFHENVGSNWIWSSEADGTAAKLAFDFAELEPVVLAANFRKGAQSLCVNDPR